MTEEQIDMLGELPLQGDRIKEIPEGEVVSVSLLPRGNKMVVKIECDLYIDFAVYESVRDAVMSKIWEIKKTIREAEVQVDV